MPVRADPRIGTDLAGYRIERLLGRGGMGVVYLAEDVRLARKVALKLLAPELAEDVRFRKRFLRESRLAASLDHQNVIPIYEAGETDGLLFIAMRYVEGTDLKGLLHKRGALAPEVAISVLAQVAGALDAAHARGLVHRDVKPGNILLADDDHVYLADFGLSRRADDRDPGAAAGGSLGTIDYLAPEQVENAAVDASADVYSLGCVLYEMLTGRPPFRSDSPMGVVWSHLEAPPPSAHAARHELDNAIDAVLDKAMAKDPAARYDACAALAEDARQALGISGVFARPAPVRPLLRRREFLAAAAAGVATAAAIPAFLLTRGKRAAKASPVRVTASSLVRLDPETGKPVAAFELGLGPLPNVSLALSDQAAWLSSVNDRTVFRVDKRTGVVKSTGLPGEPHGVAVGTDTIWVGGEQPAGGFLARLNPLTGELTGSATTTIPRAGPFATVAAHGAVWIAANDLNKGNGIVRVDPATSTIRVIDTDKLFALAAGPDGVWAVTGPATGAVGSTLGDLRLHRIDPTTLATSQTPLPHGVRLNPDLGASPIAADARAVYAAAGYSSGGPGAIAVDARSLAVIYQRHYSTAAWSIAVWRDGIWLTGAGDVIHANATDGKFIARSYLKRSVVPASQTGGASGGPPLVAIAVDDSGVWVY
jgi:predicted Ser/Thr protein kinase